MAAAAAAVVVVLASVSCRPRAGGGEHRTRGHPVAVAEDAAQLRGLLARGAGRIRLAAGVFHGPFEVDGTRGPVHLEGEGSGTWLLGSDDRPAVTTRGQVSLRGLTIAGPQSGLRIEGQADVLHCRVLAVAGSGITVAGKLDAEGLVLGALGPARSGLSVSAGGEVTLRDLQVVGPFARGLDLGGRRATVTGGVFLGPSIAVRTSAGEVALQELRVTLAPEGAHPSLSINETRARLRRLRIGGTGGGVAAGLGSVVDAEDTDVHGTRDEGLIAVVARASFRRVRVSRAAGGGLVAVGAATRLSGGWIHEAGESGLLVRNGEALVDRLILTSTGGDGLHVRAGSAWFQGAIHGTGGACVLAAESAQVRVLRTQLSACAEVALFSDSFAQLEVEDVRTAGLTGPAAVVLTQARLSVHRSSLGTAGPPVLQADCADGASVRLSGEVTLDRAGLQALGCLSEWKAPGLPPPPTEPRLAAPPQGQGPP